MRHFLSLKDFNVDDVKKIFTLADQIIAGKHKNALKGKTGVLFITGSVRTRVSYEKGIFMLGGQPIVFPCEALDKKETIGDVAGYLNNWTDFVVARLKTFAKLQEYAKYSRCPVFNAMTDDGSHPALVLTDLYKISKTRSDFWDLKYTVVGFNDNVCMSWADAAEAFGLDVTHCCPKGVENKSKAISVEHDIKSAVAKSDYIMTDSLSEGQDIGGYQITKELLDTYAKAGAKLNPCPPVSRGEEVSADAIASKYFVGHSFFDTFLTIQQAIILYCL